VNRNTIIFKIHKRICQFLFGVENVLDALTVEAHVIKVFCIEGRFRTKVIARRWAPSHWVGYIRCVWLKDGCGSAFYGDTKKKWEVR